MENINKFALAAIAVVSVAMILSTGIASAKQTSAGKTSPLFEKRAADALNAGKQVSANGGLYIFEQGGLDAVFSNSVACYHCTLCALCKATSCPACQVQQ